MKIYEDKYPLGSLKNQRTAGIYYSEMLLDNLKVLAQAIVKDNSFLLLVSSQALSVRTGKSTFVQHTAEAWNYIMLTEHKIKLDFNMNNIAFSADEFEAKAFALHDAGQKYGCCILDESDDLTGHSLSQEVKKIKRFLRKSGQLNLLMIMILPDFYEFPKPIAVNRSVALITVDYGNNFERGHWKFYDFKAKKKLYIKGKQYNDYSVVLPTLTGNFTDGYLVNEEEYRKLKYRNLKEDAQIQKDRNIASMKRSILVATFKRVVNRLKGMLTIEEVSELFEIDRRTGTNWLKSERERTAEGNNNIKLANDDNDSEEAQDEPTNS
jgi:hypothetical protein